MGLGKVKESNGLYLSVAGGFIWDRKADSSHPEYAVQTFTKVDGEEGSRQGAKYAELTGLIAGVEMRTHDKYGESINVKVTSGGDDFILSISTNNRYSQDMMKALLKIDIANDVYMKPYDFTDTKTNKRVQGISFRQDGKKIDLKTDTPEQFQKEKSWFQTTNKKNVKRYFEDLSDWFVGEIEEKVVPVFADEDTDEQAEKPAKQASVKKSKPKQEEAVEEEAEEEAEEAEDVPNITPLKMKKFLKAYIEENYEGEELPKLSKDELVVWYKLAQEMEELPFSEDEMEDASEVDDDDIQAQLDALAG
tara:strand:- start:14035 stop:14952 length:918 start_codon:yes stop_codon:yes gene_type:complete